jgi:hypothetical protein
MTVCNKDHCTDTAVLEYGEGLYRQVRNHRPHVDKLSFAYQDKTCFYARQGGGTDSP